MTEKILQPTVNYYLTSSQISKSKLYAVSSMTPYAVEQNLQQLEELAGNFKQEIRVSTLERTHQSSASNLQHISPQSNTSVFNIATAPSPTQPSTQAASSILQKI